MRSVYIFNHPSKLVAWQAMRSTLVEQYAVPVEHIHRIPLFETSALSIRELCILIHSILPKTIIDDALFDPIRNADGHADGHADGDNEASLELRRHLSYFLTFIHTCQRIAENGDKDDFIVLSDGIEIPQQKLARDRLRAYLSFQTPYLRQLLKHEDLLLLCHDGITYRKLQQQCADHRHRDFVLAGLPQTLFVPRTFCGAFAFYIKKNGAYRILHNLRSFESSLEHQMTSLLRHGTLKATAVAYRVFRPVPGGAAEEDTRNVPDTSSP